MLNVVVALAGSEGLHFYLFGGSKWLKGLASASSESDESEDEEEEDELEEDLKLAE